MLPSSVEEVWRVERRGGIGAFFRSLPSPALHLKSGHDPCWPSVKRERARLLSL
jgi:hypothetical protein